MSIVVICKTLPRFIAISVILMIVNFLRLQFSNHSVFHSPNRRSNEFIALCLAKQQFILFCLYFFYIYMYLHNSNSNQYSCQLHHRILLS